MKDKATFRGLGDKLPIDYLSDHLTSFDVIARFVSHYGWLGIILFDGVEVFRSGSFKSEMIDAITSATEMLEKNHQSFLDEYSLKK